MKVFLPVGLLAALFSKAHCSRAARQSPGDPGRAPDPAALSSPRPRSSHGVTRGGRLGFVFLWIPTGLGRGLHDGHQNAASE